MTNPSEKSSRSQPVALAAALPELADRFGLADIYVFGSRAEEFVPPRSHPGPDPAATSHPTAPEGHRSDGSHPTAGEREAESDIDIGVRPRRDRHLTARDRAELTVALEDLLDAPRVDVIVLPEAPAFLALDVISGELLYCEDAVDQAEYELYVLRRAGDLAPFERERRERLLNGS
jgi:predicted nucleotidyltransferase